MPGQADIEVLSCIQRHATGVFSEYESHTITDGVSGVHEDFPPGTVYR